MTQAAEQCREYLEEKYPGVRIGRQACRDTASGDISQHSAFQYPDYDSNALDIMGGSTDGVPWGWDDNVALIQEIVDDLNEAFSAWSIRVILWQIPAHRGHAHVDFWPKITMHMWCATRGIVPDWKYSDGHTEAHLEPAPENGAYEGDSMNYISVKADEFDFWSDTNIMSAFDRGRFESTDRAAFEQYWVEEREARTASEKARFMTDYYASGAP